MSKSSARVVAGPFRNRDAFKAAMYPVATEWLQVKGLPANDDYSFMLPNKYHWKDNIILP